MPPPANLRAISKAVLEEKSAAQRHLLEEFAGHYEGELHGVQARLALGYQAYQEGKYAEAKREFEAARGVPSLLQDYAEYYLALSEQALGNQQAVVKVLEGFDARYPVSPLAPRAALELASALVNVRRVEEAIARLEASSPQLPQPDATFLLAEAYERDRRQLPAVGAYRKVYYLYPASPQAQEAEKRLNALRRKLGRTFPAATVEMRAERAARLYEGGRWREAREEYQLLASSATGALRDLARVRMGVCQYQAGTTWPALTTLQKAQVSDPNADAERLYTMAAAYRRLGRRESMEQQIAALATKYPASEWHERALVLAGNFYLLEKQYDRASEAYRETYERFPKGNNAVAGHWKVAWRAYRDRRWEEARELLAEHIRRFPESPQISAALYWLGRLAERDSVSEAAPYYKKLLEAFPHYYYALLAQQRLASSPDRTGTANAISLEHIQRHLRGLEANGASSAKEQPARERVRLLASAWLMDWAIGELSAVLSENASASWAGSEMALLERERGRHHVALRYAKRYVPSYFAQDISAFSRDVWAALFPLPWWEQIKKQATAAKLDPYLVAGLIRQESEFDPRARSRSNARGLMQLLPSTARTVARKVPDSRARRYQLAALYTPDVNLVYGTHYLRQVLDRFNGNVEYALAGYNAGPERVDEWLRNGPYEDAAEFVESIPFTETRDYVQAVLRNAALYRQLYSDNQ
jgi:soluble lytic murein transglycosylase